jgi:hypothetical protein
MLRGLAPPEEYTPTRDTASVPMSKTETLSLPAFATKSRPPSTTTEPCDGRWGVPFPQPPVAYLPSAERVPSSWRAKASTELAAASFVWTKTAPERVSI